MTGGDARTPLVPGSRGVWFGVAGVAVLVAIALVVGTSRRDNAPTIVEAEAALALVSAMPRAAAADRGPDLSGATPAAAAERAQRASDARWETALSQATTRWEGLPQPLPREALAILAESPAPRGMAYAYGIAMTNASRVQDVLGIRDAVSARASGASAAERVDLASALRRQQVCLAGVDLAAAYGADVLTPSRVRALLDLGLVRGTRDTGLDAAFARGARRGRPADCSLT
ncbi:MAG: hypothetical protein KDC33_11365 [Thermoleophilia bacterium]|nr:hypothetical protein [Thermoleophilia bacterium]